MASRSVTAVRITADAQEYEDTHVHAIYEEIAPHFSATRYKPWPIISQFISSLPTGWIGLDSGTGNGKYLALPADDVTRVFTIGLDRSRNLLKIARIAGGSKVARDVVLGDVLDNPWRPGIFDYAISIATIHHLATFERRKLAVKRLIQAVSASHGRILIYVWALEQDELSKRKIPCESQNDAEIMQPGRDVFVPWVLTPSATPSPGPTTQNTSQVFHRYYHMFARGELIMLVNEAAQELELHVGAAEDGSRAQKGVKIEQDGWERSNYFVELRCWST